MPSREGWIDFIQSLLLSCHSRERYAWSGSAQCGLTGVDSEPGSPKLRVLRAFVWWNSVRGPFITCQCRPLEIRAPHIETGSGQTPPRSHVHEHASQPPRASRQSTTWFSKGFMTQERTKILGGTIWSRKLNKSARHCDARVRFR